MRKYLYQIYVSFIIILLGTVIDYIVHHSYASIAVPFEYFPNKIIFGGLWFIVFMNIVGYVTKNRKYQAVLVSCAVATVLQVKYFFQGYPFWFVVLFLFLHFLMFLPFSIWSFKKYGDLIIS